MKFHVKICLLGAIFVKLRHISILHFTIIHTYSTAKIFAKHIDLKKKQKTNKLFYATFWKFVRYIYRGRCFNNNFFLSYWSMMITKKRLEIIIIWETDHMTWMLYLM